MQKRSAAINDYRFSAACKEMVQIGPDRPRSDLYAPIVGPLPRPMLDVDDRSGLAHELRARQSCLSQPRAMRTGWNKADFDLSLTCCTDLTLR
ncbi:hypothetical protein SJA_C1-30080 [Sphingobium indicum UT26S]|uniref:Uncharacterized protein n=1 Tax=Sphingobium indicum (strain DSM 16413 / CCM 7287 / MTCC 6362 / UT26 / NBRC 101211 / UT26S) TaxID=452662 RepID=D4Z5G0_SPHIU|nr:hypothetical protein SJA_C1-30080 [Sphingobium indicum UT26S]